MSVNGPVKTWYLPKGLKDYEPGMDLGVPDEINPPPSFLEKGSVRPTLIKNPFSGSKTRKHGGGMPKKFKATKEEYLQLRALGLTRQQVAERYGVNIDTLKHYLTAWKIGKKADELAALEEYQNPI